MAFFASAVFIVLGIVLIKYADAISRAIWLPLVKDPETQRDIFKLYGIISLMAGALAGFMAFGNLN